jgi:hypothetical protein
VKINWNCIFEKDFIHKRSFVHLNFLEANKFSQLHKRKERAREGGSEALSPRMM